MSAVSVCKAVGDSPAIAAIPINFSEYESPAFLARYAVIRDDILIHFFTKESSTDYWTKVFPASLEAVALDKFKASNPRVQAAYIPEYASWWFRANGFSDILDKGSFVLSFLKELGEKVGRN